MATVSRNVAGAAAATTTTAPMTAGSPASGGGTFGVANGSGYPTANFVVVVDRGLSTEEKIFCSSRSANVLTVGTSGRGFDGTAAASHSNGATLEHELDAAVITALLEHVNTNAGDDHSMYLLASTAAGAGLSVAARILAVNVDNFTVEINTDIVRVKDAGIVAAKLASDAVTTVKVIDGAVTLPKFASGLRPSFVVADATARLALSPADGDLCVETSTDRWYGYTGSAWRWLYGGSNPTAARAYATGTTSCIGGAFTTILLAGETYDWGNNFAANTYVAPETRDYRIVGRASAGPQTAAERCIVSLHNNGLEMSRGFDATCGAGGATDLGGTVSDRVFLVAGDAITLRMFLTTTRNSEVGPQAAYLSVEGI